MKKRHHKEEMMIRFFGSISRPRILSLLIGQPRQAFYQREIMRRHPWISTVLVVTLIFSLLGIGYTAADSPVVATERWTSTADGGNDKGMWTVSKKSDGQVVVSGVWTYLGTVNCPFTGGSVTISGPVFSFIATGTATNSSAPSGYQDSPFTLEVKGETRSGQGSGSYAMSFTTAGWPQDFSGTWTATRIEGGGITD